jgi:hypothetical protein
MAIFDGPDALGGGGDVPVHGLGCWSPMPRRPPNRCRQPADTPGRLGRLYLPAIAVILANPKAILFYMGVLPGFFDLSRLTGPRHRRDRGAFGRLSR